MWGLQQTLHLFLIRVPSELLRKPSGLAVAAELRCSGGNSTVTRIKSAERLWRLQKLSALPRIIGVCLFCAFLGYAERVMDTFCLIL